MFQYGFHLLIVIGFSGCLSGVCTGHGCDRLLVVVHTDLCLGCNQDRTDNRKYEQYSFHLLFLSNWLI